MSLSDTRPSSHTDSRELACVASSFDGLFCGIDGYGGAKIEDEHRSDWASGGVPSLANKIALHWSARCGRWHQIRSLQEALLAIRSNVTTKGSNDDKKLTIHR